jgi:drug/metabolite transporter superfamily protein YnfA
VNGSTAIKMFSLLALITTYLVTHEEGRVPYALGMFGVFVLQLVLFVWDVATSVRSSEKKS